MRSLPKLTLYKRYIEDGPPHQAPRHLSPMIEVDEADYLPRVKGHRETVIQTLLHGHGVYPGTPTDPTLWLFFEDKQLSRVMATGPWSYQKRKDSLTHRANYIDILLCQLTIDANFAVLREGFLALKQELTGTEFAKDFRAKLVRVCLSTLDNYLCGIGPDASVISPLLEQNRYTTHSDMYTHGAAWFTLSSILADVNGSLDPRGNFSETSLACKRFFWQAEIADREPLVIMKRILDSLSRFSSAIPSS